MIPYSDKYQFHSLECKADSFRDQWISVFWTEILITTLQ